MLKFVGPRFSECFGEYIEKWPTADAVQRFYTGCATITCCKFSMFLELYKKKWTTLNLIFLKLGVKDWPIGNSVQHFSDWVYRGGSLHIGCTQAGHYILGVQRRVTSYSVYCLKTG